MTSFLIAGPDIVDEQFDGEMVILNLQTGQYFGLNESGAALWVALTSGQNPETIAGQPGADFATRLVDLGLIKTSDSDPVQGVELTLAAPPTIEVYDDLSDLIMADPIHDVDEDRGWPNRPETA
ncbi:PqqD family protein [Phaeovulum sp.]|uniref:PqqD family protein n=1 Tax=Phaeovulum sp. TaxID=2934796 RepID=UPI0039E48B42